MLYAVKAVVFFSLVGLLVASFPFYTQASVDCQSLTVVDINSASHEKLQCLIGIGETYGQRIIDQRPFVTLDDLNKVSGIGSVTVANIKDQGLAVVDSQSADDEDRDQGKININTAGIDRLTELSGIGPVTADNIIEYRRDYGEFSSIEDIKSVTGVGPGLFSDIQDHITVGDVAEKDDQGDPDPDSKEKDDSDTETKPSAHDSPVEISELKEIPALKITAGRDRLVGVENPVRFKPYIENSDQLSAQAQFEWVMGDGSVYRREKVTHRYQYPGTYTVVLTVQIGDREGVSRLTVEVIESQISIREADSDRIVLFNHSAEEINLGDWTITQGERWFAVPANTLIASGQALSLPTAVTGLSVTNGQELELQSPRGGYRDTYTKGEERESEDPEVIEAEPEAQVEAVQALQAENEKLRAELAGLRERVEVLSKAHPPAPAGASATRPIEEEPAEETSNQSTEATATDEDSAGPAGENLSETAESGRQQVIYEGPSPGGRLDNLFNLPARLIESVQMRVFNYD